MFIALTIYLFLIILITVEKLSCMIFSMQTSIVPLPGISQKTKLAILPLLSPDIKQSVAQTRANNGLYAL